MAQLVARLVRNEKAGGSNPPSSTIRTLILIQGERPFGCAEVRFGLSEALNRGGCLLTVGCSGWHLVLSGVRIWMSRAYRLVAITRIQAIQVSE